MARKQRKQSVYAVYNQYEECICVGTIAEIAKMRKTSYHVAKNICNNSSRFKYKAYKVGYSDDVLEE